MWAGTCTDIDAQKRFEDEARRHAAELKASRAELAHMVRHGVLTGLPNRLMFEDRLGQALAVAERHGGSARWRRVRRARVRDRLLGGRHGTRAQTAARGLGSLREGSSINHALRLPLHGLKIAHEVVRDVADPDVATDARAARVFEALVGLGHALDHDVTAGGIESEAQRRHAIALGCCRLQGFLFGTPLTDDEADALVATWESPAGNRG